MAGFNYKGDVDSVKQKQLDFISDVLAKRGFKSAEVTIQPMGKAGDNYMSNVKKIDVSENGKSLNIVAKLALDNPMMRETGNITAFFSNEHTIYTEVFPKFKELQRSAGVSKEDCFRFPECYGSSLDEPDEIILLENLTIENFGHQNRLKPLPNECIKMALKQLAIYHSLSYVLKHQEPETYAAITSKLIDLMKTPITEIPEFLIFYKSIEDGAIAMMTDDKYRKALKGSAGDIIAHINKVKDDAGSKRLVIQQGDGWTNNILFKYEVSYCFSM